MIAGLSIHGKKYIINKAIRKKAEHKSICVMIILIMHIKIKRVHKTDEWLPGLGMVGQGDRQD